LREHGFDVVRAAAWADERAVVFVELASAELPAVERHVGPPVSVGTHAERFYETYADDDGVYGPFVDDGGRYVVERDRDVRTAGGFARTELGTVALGARIESRVASGDYDVYVGDAVVEALLPEFESELAAYVDPKA
ncbi:tRNA CCA-pyrophosphorylase, partial [Halobacterium salinarum]|nr:tRNA CCA-pyrophosphorylase [Halobacterium salinarum]